MGVRARYGPMCTTVVPLRVSPGVPFSVIFIDFQRISSIFQSFSVIFIDFQSFSEQFRVIGAVSGQKTVRAVERRRELGTVVSSTVSSTVSRLWSLTVSRLWSLTVLSFCQF